MINATDLPRYMRCNGSQMLGGIAPPSANADTTVRDEGTAAHWVIRDAFETGNNVAQYHKLKAPNGVIISDEIISHIADYIETIRKQSLLEYGCEGDASFDEIGARYDHFSFDGQTLRINDFKYGFRIVDPDENWTMLAYAIGLCLRNQWVPERIVLTICQPRVPHPDGQFRSWELSYPQLVERYHQITHAVANPDGTLRTGSHCDKCPNALTCPALRTAVFNAVDVSVTAHSETISDEQVSRELTILQDAEKRIKSRKKQLEDLAIYRLRQGASVPGYGMQRSLSNRAWRDGLEPAFLSIMLGVPCVRSDAISPAQAVAAGADENAVNMLSERKETGLKLTRISPEKMFGKVKG